jgi:hypothetical protein
MQKVPFRFFLMSRTSLGIYKDVFFVKVIENGQGLEEEPEPSR